MYGSPQRRAQNFFLNSGSPATLVLIAANVLTFLVGFSTMRGRGASPLDWLVFTDATWPTFFWTLFTWPLVAPVDLIGLIFGGLWAYWIGGSLERSWGTRPFVVFLLATCALTALTLWVGGVLLRAPVVAHGLWLAMAAPTIAWCVLNAREVIRLYAVLPVPAPLLAWLTVALTWFQISVSGRHPLLGLFALSGCAAAYWYARNGRFAFSGGGGSSSGRFGGLRSDRQPPLRFRDFDREPAEPARGRGWSLDRWLRERKQRRELERLWKRSPDADDPEGRNRR